MMNRGSVGRGSVNRGSVGRGSSSRGRGLTVVKPAPIHPDCERGARDYRRVGFVHVNKAGGTAMIALMRKYAMHQALWHPAVAPGATQRIGALGSRFFHASANLQREAVGREAWESSYTFGLVRNPWSRHVSNFFFLMQSFCGNATVGAPRVRFCDERVMPNSGPWMLDTQQAARRFRQWVLASASAFPLGSPKEHLFSARSHGNERDPWFNASQASWFTDARGRDLVQEIIRLEDLEASWPRLQRAICGLRHARYSEMHELNPNPSTHEHYSSYYDDQTRDLVAKYAAGDLTRFGYRFETPAAAPARLS